MHDTVWVCSIRFCWQVLMILDSLVCCCTRRSQVVPPVFRVRAVRFLRAVSSGHEICGSDKTGYSAGTTHRDQGRMASHYTIRAVTGNISRSPNDFCPSWVTEASTCCIGAGSQPSQGPRERPAYDECRRSRPHTCPTGAKDRNAGTISRRAPARNSTKPCIYTERGRDQHRQKVQFA